MNSCYHCTRRKPGCHSVCEDYKRDCEDRGMKRVKVLIVLFVCMAVMAVWLVMALLTDALGLLAALLNAAEKLLNDTGTAVQRAAIDLANTARGWLRWAVR